MSISHLTCVLSTIEGDRKYDPMYQEVIECQGVEALHDILATDSDKSLIDDVAERATAVF